MVVINIPWAKWLDFVNNKLRGREEHAMDIHGTEQSLKYI